MKHLFQKHEIQLIIWTSVIFLFSVGALVIFGLIPSEFQVNGGETFEQKTRNAIREIVEGKTTSTLSADQGTTRQVDATGRPNSVTNVTNANYVNPNTGGEPAPYSGSGNTSIHTEDPVRIVIPSIGVDGSILNPKATSFEVLDSALTKGAVRYPGSGYPGSGNMFIFGHSTSFSVVQNQAYKIFNKLKDVKTGDTITVYGTAAVYQYRVTSVKKVEKDKALVTFDSSKNMLTLSTCDSFGRDQDRFVVEAEYIGASTR